jgi:hypothetical protein
LFTSNFCRIYTGFAQKFPGVSDLVALCFLAWVWPVEVGSYAVERKRYAGTAALGDAGSQSEKKLFDILPLDWFDRILKDFFEDFAMFVVHCVCINNTKK